MQLLEWVKALRKWCRLGLTQRIISYVLLVAAVPVILVALFSFRAGSQGIRTHTEAHLTSVVIVKAQEVERWVRPFEAGALVLSRSQDVTSDVATLLRGTSGPESEEARQRLARRFNQLIESRIGLLGVAIVSAETRKILASTGPGPSLDLSTIPLNSGLPNNLISLHMRPYKMEDAAAHVAISAPIAMDGQALAYVVLLASPSPIYETLSPDPALGANSKVYLVNKRGEILTPPQLLPEGPIEGLRSEIASMSGGSAMRGTEYIDFMGTRVVAAYQPLQHLEWGVVAELPTSVAFSDIEQMRWVIGGATALFFLLIAGAAILISRSIARPVRTLAAGARAIGSGNLSYRIQVKSSDELGLLADSFNQMAGDLATTQNRVLEAEKAATLQAFTEQKVEQLKRLSRLGLLLARESSLPGLVNRTPDLARETTRADIAAVIVFSEDGEYIEQVKHTETERPDSIEHLLQDRGFLKLLENGQSIHHYLDDEGRCTSGTCNAAFHEFNAILTVPLHADAEKAAGAIVLANLGNQTWFAEEDQELLQIIAGYVSATLQKMRKENRLQYSEQKAREAYDELQHAQEQLVQAQKMESIGRLAGGVAHDFNNLLTPIMGYAQLSLRAIPDGEERLRTNLLEIQDAAERASNLTRQLLAFSRKQVLEPKVINVNKLMLNMDKMLRRLIGEDIELATVSGPDLGVIKADPGQIEQVIMNLVVNARDAMPAGGNLTIGTDDVVLDREYCKLHPNVEPGQYVKIAVTDSGMGIPENVMAHIFEPFFTTKGEGKGTGLGLATCYGIVQQNRGHIAVYSEPGQGTTFKIYLPIVEGEAVAESIRRQEEVIPTGSETVLLVEDERLVRQLATRVLQEQGYTVLEASNGIEALELFKERESEGIDILLTDVIMPVMGGRELAERVRELRPDIKILYISGYTDDAIIRFGMLPPGTAFAEKPFSATALAVKVRQVLDESIDITAPASTRDAP